MKVELRYLDRKTGHKYTTGGQTVFDCRETVLQWRYEYDPPHSPYPQKWWTDWQDVPTVKEEEDERTA